MAVNLAPPKAVSNSSVVNVSKSQMTIFEAILMIVLVAIAYPYLIKPKMQEVKNATARINSLKGDLADMEKTTQDLNDLKRVLTRSENEAKINVLDESLPLQTRVTQTFVLVDTLISRAALTRGNLTVDQAADLGGVYLGKTSEFAQERKLVPVNIDVSMTGAMENFTSFLQLLEQDNRVMDVQHLEITPEKEGILSFHLNIKTYLYAPAVTAQ